MKKNTKLKKQIIFLLATFALFSVAGMASAQFKATSINVKDTTSIQVYKGSTTTQKEIGNIEKSVSKTEDVFNNLDKVVGSKDNSDNSDNLDNSNNFKKESDVNDNLNKRVRSIGVKNNLTKDAKEIDISNGGSDNSDNTTNETNDNLNSRVRSQVEVLKALRKDGISKIIQNANVFKEDVNKKSEVKDTKSEDNKKEVNIRTTEVTGQKTPTETNSDILNGLTNTDINNQLNGIENSVSKTSGDIKKLENITLQKKEKIIARTKTKKAIAQSLKDSDGDGISDYDEINIYGTNPFVADTNGDGYGDGAEILAGFNPKSKSGNAIIAYQNPKNSGGVDKSLFSVSSIKVKKVKEKIKVTNNVKTSEVATTSNMVSFKGKSLPNSFVTLYIFSIPTVVTVKTDADGNWDYTMDKELQNGNHEIYVAMTDNTGKIITKSNPIPFVKEALAVTVNKQLLSNNIDNNKPSFFNFGYVYVTILILVFLIGIVLTVIGVKLRVNNKKTEGTEDIV